MTLCLGPCRPILYYPHPSLTAHNEIPLYKTIETRMETEQVGRPEILPHRTGIPPQPPQLRDFPRTILTPFAHAHPKTPPLHLSFPLAAFYAKRTITQFSAPCCGLAYKAKSSAMILYIFCPSGLLVVACCFVELFFRDSSTTEFEL